MNERLTQTRIEGTYDPPVPEVQEAAEEYVDLLYGRMRTQEMENAARDRLVELMKEYDVKEVELDGYEIKRQHIEQDKVKVKKVKVEEPEDDDHEEIGPSFE